LTGKQNSFDVRVKLLQYSREIQTEALIDSGAYSCFIHHDFVQQEGLFQQPLGRHISVYNADGTENKKGIISQYVKATLRIGNHTNIKLFLVTNIGKQSIIVGMSFLKKHNPEFDWKGGDLRFTRCPEACRPPHMMIQDEDLDKIKIPHLEDVASDSYGQLNDDQWDSKEHFAYWLLHSDNPIARITRVRLLPEEDLHLTAAGELDREYWSKHVPLEYQEFGDIFLKKASERMPTWKPYDHAIDLIPNTTLPKPSKLYPLNIQEQTSLDKWIDGELSKGYIRQSKSPTAAPVFFVKKKDGSLRLVQDYRALNAVTKKNKFPLPRVPNLIDQLSKASTFTSMDLCWGYNNIHIKEGDEEKAAFITHRGLFKPTVMYFGFCNAPSTFQAMMNEVLKEEIATGHVVVYIDNILIFTDDLTLHRQLVKQVLEKLRRNNLFCKPEKCHFEQLSVSFLGLVVSKNSIIMDQSKVEGVKNWPTPTKVKHVQAFLGLANFYRRFIKDFSKIACPLTFLTCKDTPWSWGPEQEQAFQGLKNTFTTAPILQIPNDTAPYRLETDSSDFATGAILEQMGEDGVWHPVAFYSKSLNEHEQNYKIYNKELVTTQTGRNTRTLNLGYTQQGLHKV
jgi:hypothetical protein